MIINIAPAEFNEHVVGHAPEWIKGHIANLTNLTTWIFLLRQERTVHKGSETFSHNYYIFFTGHFLCLFFIMHSISPSMCKVHNVCVLEIDCAVGYRYLSWEGQLVLASAFSSTGSEHPLPRSKWGRCDRMDSPGAGGHHNPVLHCEHVSQAHSSCSTPASPHNNSIAC